MADDLDTKASLAGLKRWLEAREEHEATSAHPVPLTVAERKAIRVLQPPPSPQEERDMGQEDWISLLQMYQNAHKDMRHVYEDIAAGHQIWRCTCTVTYRGHTETFPPDEQLSAEPGQPISNPTFARKKDAKRYAAKLAYLWLLQQDHPGAFARLPRPASSPAPAPVLPTPTPTPSQVPATATLSAAAAAAAAPPSPAQPPAKRRREAPDPDPPATEQVTRLCAKLGIRAPQYELAQTALAAGYWDGRLRFDHDQDVPDGLGTVANIYGRDGARQLMAQQCLQWLVALEAEREQRFRSLVPMAEEESA